MSKLVFVVFCVLWCETLGHPPLETRLHSKHVNISDFPYHASVQRAVRSEQHWQHVCSGALVLDSWIITAASCVYDTTAPSVGVLLGSSTLGDRYPSGEAEASMRLNVSKIVVHHAFDLGLRTNNIALLQIEASSRRAIAASSLVRTIFLPSSENYHLRNGTMLVVSGWKKLRQVDGFESQLSATSVPLVNQQTCARSMPGYKAVAGKMLCAGYSETDSEQRKQQYWEDGRKTCEPDLGAPLANHDILVGIFSSKDECQANSKYPGIYTRISTFLPWIQKIISSG